MSPRHKRDLPSEDALKVNSGEEIIPNGVPAVGLTLAEKLTRKKFARRLEEAMAKVGYSNSDLARLVWGTTTDAKGYTVALKRDMIGKYRSTDRFPSPVNLLKLAEALNVSVDWLSPESGIAQAERTDSTPFQMTAIAGNPGVVYLRINKLVSLANAAQIVAIISADQSEQADT